MKSIHFNDVDVPENRQRKEFKEASLKELALSLQRPHGQLNPIILRDDHKTLVCGERRLRSMEHVKKPLMHDGEAMLPGHLAYVVLGDLSEEELYEAELEENVQREDLTWQERVQAIAALHEFRSTSNPNQTAKDTATEIYGEGVSGRKQSEVQKAIELAQFLDDPLVQHAPDEKTARKAIKAELENRKRLEAAARIDHDDFFHQLFSDSCYTCSFEDFFDVVVCDPPYGIDMHKKDTFDADSHEYDDSDEAFQQVLDQLPRMAHRACREAAHAYVFCDIRRFSELFVAFELAGWNVWTKPIIWDKGTVGSYGNIEYGPRACYDAILFARKGDRKQTAGYRDVINIQQQTNLAHPAGKPVELISELLKRSVYPGDRVADFFCGSGPIFPAATEHQCVAYGWEINPKYFAMAQESRARAEGKE